MSRNENAHRPFYISIELFAKYIMAVDLYIYNCDFLFVCLSVCSVPARLGKGQGAKEIAHNLACEQPKFGHNLVRKRHKIGHTFTHERPKFGLVGD